MIKLNCEVCVQRITSSESCDKYMKTFQSSQELYACKKCSGIPSETSTGCTQCDLQRGRWLDKKYHENKRSSLRHCLRNRYVRVNSHVNPERAARFAKKSTTLFGKCRTTNSFFEQKIV